MSMNPIVQATLRVLTEEVGSTAVLNVRPTTSCSNLNNSSTPRPMHVLERTHETRNTPLYAEGNAWVTN